jgi:hypothetical protein
VYRREDMPKKRGLINEIDHQESSWKNADREITLRHLSRENLRLPILRINTL